MTHVVITGVTGARNRGVEALVRSIVAGLRRALDGVQVTVLTRTTDYDRERFAGENIRFVDDVFMRPPRPEEVLRRIASNRWKRFHPMWQEAKKTLEAADLVLATGGDIFGPHHEHDIAKHLAPLELALRLDHPVVFLGQSIGPFPPGTGDSWSRIARQAALITLRERRSFEYVTCDLGIDGRTVAHTADPGFLLEPAPDARIKALRAFYGIREDKETIAVVASAGISRYERVSRSQHARGWAGAIRGLLEETSAQVLLLPHAQEAVTAHDDRGHATQILEHLHYPDRVYLIGGDHSASDFKGLIATCALTISERMHAVIAALSSARAAVAIGYSVKASGILEDVVEADRASDLLGHVSEVLQPDRLVRRALSAWNARAEIARDVVSSLDEVRSRAEENYRLVKDVVSG